MIIASVWSWWLSFSLLLLQLQSEEQRLCLDGIVLEKLIEIRGHGSWRSDVAYRDRSWRALVRVYCIHSGTAPLELHVFALEHVNAAFKLCVFSSQMYDLLTRNDQILVRLSKLALELLYKFLLRIHNPVVLLFLLLSNTTAQDLLYILVLSFLRSLTDSDRSLMFTLIAKAAFFIWRLMNCRPVHHIRSSLVLLLVV